jgi:hypothetical protein
MAAVWSSPSAPIPDSQHSDLRGARCMLDRGLAIGNDGTSHSGRLFVVCWLSTPFSPARLLSPVEQTGLLLELATAAVTGLMFIRTTDGRHPTKAEVIRARHFPLG